MRVQHAVANSGTRGQIQHAGKFVFCEQIGQNVFVFDIDWMKFKTVIRILGAELIENALKAEVDADYYATITRRPAVYRGNPFLVEVGLAYGGDMAEIQAKVIEIVSGDTLVVADPAGGERRFSLSSLRCPYPR